tara:strand:+ start:16373 stop:17026 length:654 start_codon:yes stop_codon:yes gene_type:complete
MMSALSQVPLFAGLAAADIELLESSAKPRAFPKHTVIMTEGDETDSLYVVLSGRLRVYCCNDDGKEITLRDLHGGDCFGELALLGGSERSASVITVDAVRCLVISSPVFRELISSSPELALNLIRSLASLIRHLTENVKSLALLDVYGRVAHTLLELSDLQGGQRVTSIPMTQQDIASRVGASREMVAKILKDLETGGYISTNKKRIVIREKLPAKY